MSLRHIAVIISVVAVVCIGALELRATGQTGEVVLTVSSTTDQPIPFRGAIMFRDGSLQVVEGQTPFEVKGRGAVAVGMFERIGQGPEIRVALSAGQGSATGIAGSVVVGHEVIRGIGTFARTF